MYRTARALFTLGIVTVFLGTMSLFANLEDEDEDDNFQEE
jgi:hypothetical protein